MGRIREPVYERGPGGGDDAAAQAGRPAGDRDGAWSGLPAGSLTPILRALRRTGGPALTALLGGYLRPSLRRRVALALSVAFAVGYLVLLLVVSVGAHWPILIIPVAALALAPWGWWFVSGLLLRPLSDTTQTVRELGPQNLGQRIRMTGGADPMRELADAIDGAMDRFVAGYEGQRRFAANASHELRTPLAVQRLLTEVAMDDPAASEDLHRLGVHLLRTNERSERLIEGLLVLAESDRGLPGTAPLRLDELADSVIGSHQEMAGKHGLSLRRSLAERHVPGDPPLLERLIANLVTNAITYNEPGGWVEVEVASEPGPALTVRNTGQPVPAEAVDGLFEPFRRLAADRTNQGGGVGLGLSIVRSITAAHGGTLQARPRPGGGLIVEIDLPPKP